MEERYVKKLSKKLDDSQDINKSLKDETLGGLDQSYQDQSSKNQIINDEASQSQLSQTLNTHDSRVVKTVRSLKNDQFRRPESAAQNSNKASSDPILRIANNNIPQIPARNETSTKILLQHTKEAAQNDSQLYNENIYSPALKLVTLANSNSTKENQQNTQSQSLNEQSEISMRPKRVTVPITNAKSLPRTQTSQQRDVNIRKNHRPNMTPGKQAIVNSKGTQSQQTKLIEIVPQLTKQIEDQLIDQSREKVYECIRNSTSIHDALERSQIDKGQIIDILYSNKLFKFQLAKLLFNMKIIIKKKIEDYVLQKIQEIIKEREVDQKLMEKFTNVQQKLQSRMAKLQNLAYQYG